ncbi:MAG TPA: hypothetical protein PLZ73_04200, partial [bacterium]|nr:hypothetical protein [bacterium]
DPLQGGGVKEVAALFWRNTREYVASGQTVAWSALIEALQVLLGPGVWKVRVLAALGGAFGTGTVFLVARRRLQSTVAATSAALMSAFSVVGIIFGQFADVYASAVFATSVQLLAWVRLDDHRESRTAWSGFAAAALVAQLLMYTQVWITAACFLTTVFGSRRRWKYMLRSMAVPAGAYFVFSLAHFYGMLRIIPWSESYRWYMSSYYPAPAAGPAPGLGALLSYFPLRVYDLLAYHWAAVFNPGMYQPLGLNPVVFPFLAVLVTAGLLFLFGKKRADGALAFLSLAAVGAALAANAVRLLPFGGIRQTLFLHPVLVLFYGWATAQVLVALPSRRWYRRWAGGICCLLPLVPFSLSLPGIYRDRLPRLDLDILAGLMRENGVRDLCASEQNIQILELAMRENPSFSEVTWPGYPHPADALDADFRSARPILRFKLEGTTGRVHWVTRDYFPSVAVPLIWIDMHISRGSRFEGEGMKNFYPEPGETVGDKGEIRVLLERPGNSPASIHQSLYWPPNSYYLYLIEPRPGRGREPGRTLRP